MAQREEADVEMRPMNETLRRLHKMPPKPHKEKRGPEGPRRGSGEKAHDQPSDRPKAGR
jgi:hypothetical protein